VSSSVEKLAFITFSTVFNRNPQRCFCESHYFLRLDLPQPINGPHDRVHVLLRKYQYTMLCYVMLYYVMLCYVMLFQYLCHIMSWCRQMLMLLFFPRTICLILSYHITSYLIMSSSLSLLHNILFDSFQLDPFDPTQPDPATHNVGQ
jgi:hypothetical protein